MGLRYMPDLRYKLIRNDSECPFITSDHPVAFYNQYMDMKGSLRGVTGYGSLGLQIIFPLSPKHLILFYDHHVYKLGNKKDKVIHLKDKKDIDQFNLLQLLNSNHCVYFNNEIDEAYLNKLFNRSKSFSRANEVITKQFPPPKKDQQPKGGYIYTRRSGLSTGLDLSFIKFLSAAKATKIDRGRIHLRPYAEYLQDSEKFRRR